MPLRLALAVAATALSLTAPAQAGPPNDATYRGGCFLVAYNETTQLVNPVNHWEGVLGTLVVSSAPTLGHNLVKADVLCEIYVNNVFTAGSPLYSGTGVTTGLGAVAFTASPNDVITLCTRVTTTDAHAQVKVFPANCVNAVITPLLPQPVYDAAWAICDSINEYTLCALLKANQGHVLYAF